MKGGVYRMLTLQQGQSAPKDDAQKQQQEKPKKNKGMKV